MRISHTYPSINTGFPESGALFRESIQYLGISRYIKMFYNPMPRVFQHFFTVSITCRVKVPWRSKTGRHSTHGSNRLLSMEACIRLTASSLETNWSTQMSGKIWFQTLLYIINSYLKLILYELWPNCFLFVIFFRGTRLLEVHQSVVDGLLGSFWTWGIHEVLAMLLYTCNLNITLNKMYICMYIIYIIILLYWNTMKHKI